MIVSPRLEYEVVSQIGIAVETAKTQLQDLGGGVVDLAEDKDFAGAGVLSKAAGKHDGADGGGTIVQLEFTGLGDFARDDDVRLMALFDDDGDLGVVQAFGDLGTNLVVDLVDGFIADVEAADEVQADVAIGRDGDGLVEDGRVAVVNVEKIARDQLVLPWRSRGAGGRLRKSRKRDGETYHHSEGAIHIRSSDT